MHLEKELVLRFHRTAVSDCLLYECRYKLDILKKKFRDEHPHIGAVIRINMSLFQKERFCGRAFFF